MHVVDEPVAPVSTVRTPGEGMRAIASDLGDTRNARAKEPPE